MTRQQSFLTSMLVLLGSAMVGGIALAQDTTPKATTPAHEMKHDEMKPSAMGMHDMPGTVTEVDHKTGMVEVESMNMKLKVHFPASTVADLKKGDKITLHLGYSKQ